MSSVPHSYYSYTPSVPAAIVFAVLYSTAFVATVILWIRYRAWVWLAMVLAALMESLGYIARIISANNPDSRGVYIAQFCLIVLAPVLMAAAYYMIFSRIVFHTIPPRARTTKFLWVPPNFITPIFVTCDIIAFMLQLAGAVIISGTKLTDADAQSKLDQGKKLALVGLGTQICCFGLFSIITVRLHFTSKQFDEEFTRRVGCSKGDKYFAIDERKRKLETNWRVLLMVVNTTCLLILIRSVYRVCDFALGKQSYLEEHEWCAYALDAVPILPCVALYIYWHPAKYLPFLSWHLPNYIRKDPGDYQLQSATPVSDRVSEVHSTAMAID